MNQKPFLSMYKLIIKKKGTTVVLNIKGTKYYIKIYLKRKEGENLLVFAAFFLVHTIYAKIIVCKNYFILHQYRTYKFFHR